MRPMPAESVHGGLLNLRKMKMFLFYVQGGPALRGGRAGEHLPRDQKRSALFTRARAVCIAAVPLVNSFSTSDLTHFPKKCNIWWKIAFTLDDFHGKAEKHDCSMS